MEKLETIFKNIESSWYKTEYTSNAEVCAQETKKIAVEFAKKLHRSYFLSNTINLDFEKLFNEFIEEYETLDN